MDNGENGMGMANLLGQVVVIGGSGKCNVQGRDKTLDDGDDIVVSQDTDVS
jgi:hypothetical protein